MIRRMFWALLGLGFGLVLGMRVLRKLDRITEAVKPGAVAERTGRKVGSTSSRLRTALEAGRDHAQLRETELRQRYGVPSLLEIAPIERDARDTTTNTDANEA
jgi:hypothetical protein